MSRRNELRKLVDQTLDELGVGPREFGHNQRGHQTVEFAARSGVLVKFVFPNTPSDRRSALNTRAGLKRKAMS